MAAIDLQRSLEAHHGGPHHRRVWGGGPDVPLPHDAATADTFDSEMQEWEDQLHDMQRKIEELYNEVQARRGGSDVGAGDDLNNNNNQRRKNGVVGPEFSLVGGHSDDSGAFCGGSEGGGRPHVATAAAAPNHHRANGQRTAIPSSRLQNGGSHGFPSNSDDAVSQIYGDLLQGYLGQAKGTEQRNNNNGRARRVHFDQTVKVSQDLPAYQEDMNRRPEMERTSQEHFRHGGNKESSPNKENNSNSHKPPLRQRDTFVATSAGAPPTPLQRSNALPSSSSSSDSPVPERKQQQAFTAADRKCVGGSPSVLRKFGAMLQENEGKTLTDGGVVTTTTSTTCQQQQQSPSCQRRAGGGLVAGSPKLRPRANSGTAHHHHHHQDYRALNASSSPSSQRVQRSAVAAPLGQSPPRGGGSDNDRLIELLDMLDIKHDYGSPSSSPSVGARGGQAASHRQDAQQGIPDESSPSPSASKKSFSRPSRPANQRPPSRWAGRAPSSSSSTHGPMYRPPSPLARPPSPMTPSPICARKQPTTYRLHAETVIM